MKTILSLLIALAAFFPIHSAQAAISPISISTLPPLQFPPSDFTVTGARVSALWGKHRDLYGLDVGLLGNITDQTFTGLALSGIFNLTHGTTTALGAQIAGLTNINTNKTNIIGLQLALGANINQAASTVEGIQLALLTNYSPFTDIYGLQAGIYNVAKEVYGFQIGVVNVCDNLHGIQIGLVNFHRKGLISVSPILNIGF